VIRQAKIEGEAKEYWQDFVELYQALEKKRQKLRKH
jgi:hypothetical protein